MNIQRNHFNAVNWFWVQRFPKGKDIVCIFILISLSFTWLLLLAVSALVAANQLLWHFTFNTFSVQIQYQSSCKYSTKQSIKHITCHLHFTNIDTQCLRNNSEMSFHWGFWDLSHAHLYFNLILYHYLHCRTWWAWLIIFLANMA